MSVLTRVLAIETSCDDTSVAIVNSEGGVEACLSAHQDLVHSKFGGIVPEIASRQHSEHLIPLVNELLNRLKVDLKQLDGVVATSRPGLLGSLMVGVVTAKTLSLGAGIPWLGVNHIEGHILAPFLNDSEYQPPKDFGYPFMSLVISGGHSHLFLVRELGQYQLIGQTVDDAAGEAFDKFAKMLGLGYPGGVLVDKSSQGGDPRKFHFPRAMMQEENFDFSFSGLKTAAKKVIDGLSETERKNQAADLSASYQEAIVDVLLSKLERAALKYAIQRISITGGVSANSRLRSKAHELASRRGWILAMPPVKYCTDNAAMIGIVGAQRILRGETSLPSDGPSPSSLSADFQT